MYLKFYSLHYPFFDTKPNKTTRFLLAVFTFIVVVAIRPTMCIIHFLFVLVNHCSFTIFSVVVPNLQFVCSCSTFFSHSLICRSMFARIRAFTMYICLFGIVPTILNAHTKNTSPIFHSVFSCFFFFFQLTRFIFYVYMQ